MIQRAHRMNRCVNIRAPASDAGVRLVKRRVGVADGDDDVARGHTANRVEAAD